MALFLREADVQRLVSPADVIRAVEAVAAAQAHGKAWLVPRQRLRMAAGMLHTMSAAWPERGWFAHKAYAAIGGDVRFRVFLYDAAGGELCAVMEGNRLGQLRTGAATAVAAKFLQPRARQTWALFGTGLQAYGQLESLREVAGRPADLRVYGRNAERRATFVANVRADLELPAVAAASADACADGANVVVTATTSREPVFDGNRLARGAFIAAVGANLLIKRELDGAALKIIDRIIVDDVETAQRESGLLQSPMEAGFMHWNDVQSLPQLVAGRAPARDDDRETLCFHSLGSATWDLAAAIVAYERAVQAGAGTAIPLT